MSADLKLLDVLNGVAFIFKMSTAGLGQIRTLTTLCESPRMAVLRTSLRTPLFGINLVACLLFLILILLGAS